MKKDSVDSAMWYLEADQARNRSHKSNNKQKNRFENEEPKGARKGMPKDMRKQKIRGNRWEDWIPM